MVSTDSAVDETIESIAELERRALADSTRHQRAIERLTVAVGRPRTLYVAAILIGLWVALNALAAFIHLRPLDTPPFPWLGTAASVASLLTTIMILVAANRGDRLDEQRDRLFGRAGPDVVERRRDHDTDPGTIPRSAAQARTALTMLW